MVELNASVPTFGTNGPNAEEKALDHGPTTPGAPKSRVTVVLNSSKPSAGTVGPNAEEKALDHGLLRTDPKSREITLPTVTGSKWAG